MSEPSLAHPRRVPRASLAANAVVGGCDRTEIVGFQHFVDLVRDGVAVADVLEVGGVEILGQDFAALPLDHRLPDIVLGQMSRDLAAITNIALLLRCWHAAREHAGTAQQAAPGSLSVVQFANRALR